MLRLWGKVLVRSRIVRSETAGSSERELPRQERIETCVKELAMALDLPCPIWLDSNRKDMDHFGRTRFTQDHFIEAFPYDALEIEIIETDDEKQKHKR